MYGKNSGGTHFIGVVSLLICLENFSATCVGGMHLHILTFDEAVQSRQPVCLVSRGGRLDPLFDILWSVLQKLARVISFASPRSDEPFQLARLHMPKEFCTGRRLREECDWSSDLQKCGREVYRIEAVLATMTGSSL